MDCNQKCNQGRNCTCGQITPMLYRLIALDIWVFKVVTLGNAKPGETISAASYRADVLQGRIIGKLARPCIDFLASLFGSSDHCKNAYFWQFNIYQD